MVSTTYSTQLGDELGGTTLLIDLLGCDIDILNDVDVLTSMLVDLPKNIGLRAIDEPRVKHWTLPGAKDKMDEGWSGSILFAESHCYFHTWPLLGKMWFDLTACGKPDANNIFGKLKEMFGARTGTLTIKERS